MRIGLILGDQLSDNLATLRHLEPGQDHLVMAEVPAEARYVRHHKQKIAFLFSAMRHHCARLIEAGWQVDYYRFGEHDHPDLAAVLGEQVRVHKANAVVVTECGEYRLQQAIENHWPKQVGVTVTCLEDDRFICPRPLFSEWARGRKQLRMEFFYREMRRRTGLLMAGDQPEGGQWNFDQDNRKRWSGDPPLPEPLVFSRDDIDTDVVTLVERTFPDHPGSLASFSWATTRADALRALEHFVAQRLPHFGHYQDAMATGADTLFHSLLSPYMNAGLLDPMEVCQAAEQAWYDKSAPLNAVEGFIRQVIGWREFVRGIYWLCMPDYADENRLANERPLPAFYWSGNTRMHCVSESLRNTFENGYAHHIQRLMVTGNLALLTGVTPREICDWYLAVYVDAYDWVELPNTLGMVMHADGGYLGSKPYAASGSYINRMGDYCKTCHYNVKTADEADSCPFNSLYWHFINRHRPRFEKNPRMRMIYRTHDRMNAEKRDRTLQRAEQLLSTVDEL
jgi:deoxyribodipyrimidine photolyase-related protein